MKRAESENKKMIIGIVGCGMIGDSISVLTTGHGMRTVCCVRNADKIPGYRKQYKEYYRQLTDRGILTQDRAEICESYLHYTLSYDDLADCDVIFECIVENLEAKHRIYEAIEASCPQVKAVCSVSSSFLPDALGEGLGELARKIIVTHPFNPAHMVPYFEICGGKRTEPGLCEWVKEFLTNLDRKPAILKKANPGFIGNYLQFALWAAALKLVEDGVCDPQDVDTCLNYSFCPRYTSIGIFEHFDNGGYKLNKTTCDGVFPKLPRYEQAPELIKNKAESPDAWGAASPTKRGFYDWNGVDFQAYAERVNAPYWDFCRWNFPKNAEE